MDTPMDDLLLLEGAVDLTRRRVNAPLARVFEHVHGRRFEPSDLISTRLAILRLERDGLLVSDAELNLEPTPDGRTAIEIVRTLN